MTMPTDFPCCSCNLVAYGNAVCRLQLQLQQWCNLYSVSIVFFIRFTTNNVAPPRPLGTCLIAHGMGVTVETRRIGWKVALIKGFNKLFKLTRVSLSVCLSALRVSRGSGQHVNGHCLPTVCGQHKPEKEEQKISHTLLKSYTLQQTYTCKYIHTHTYTSAILNVCGCLNVWICACMYAHLLPQTTCCILEKVNLLHISRIFICTRIWTTAQRGQRAAEGKGYRRDWACMAPSERHSHSQPLTLDNMIVF